MTRDYRSIVAHYECCLERHGDSHLGVDWPKRHELDRRYRVMLEVIRPQPRPVRLLDFGCGAAHLLEYIQRREIEGIDYTGLDISSQFVELCERKFPCHDFLCSDLLDESVAIPRFDYVVMNGVFTKKLELPFDAMNGYFQELVKRVFSLADKGIAFNVISKHVDWENEDLFHVPHDLLAHFVIRGLGTRHYVFRSDYGLYEYTTYVYREANHAGAAS